MKSPIKRCTYLDFTRKKQVNFIWTIFFKSASIKSYKHLNFYIECIQTNDKTMN